MAGDRGWAKIVNLASRGQAAHLLPVASLPNTRTPAPPASAEAQTSPTAGVATPDAGSDTALKPASSSLPSISSGLSIEDQQRFLMNLARQAADLQNFKCARQQLDEAEKLYGPMTAASAGIRWQNISPLHLST